MVVLKLLSKTILWKEDDDAEIMRKENSRIKIMMLISREKAILRAQIMMLKKITKSQISERTTLDTTLVVLGIWY
jgi:hypothetical protein